MEDTWQKRLDKENNLINAYKDLYYAQVLELGILTKDSVEYCKLKIQQLQLEDEIQAKEMYLERLIADKEQQALMVERKAKFAEEQGDKVLTELRKKLSNPMVKGNEAEHYRALLKQANEADVLSPEYNNTIFNIATALGKL